MGELDYRNDVTMAQFVFLSIARNFPRNFARYRLCYCRNWKWQQIYIHNTFIGYDLSKWRKKCSILCGCETTRLRLLVPLEVSTFWRLSNVLNIWTHFPKLLQDLHIEAMKSSSTRLNTTWFTSSTTFITFCLIVIVWGRDNIWLQLMHWSSALISAITPYMYEADGKLTHFSFSSLGTFYCIQLLPLY